MYIGSQVLEPIEYLDNSIFIDDHMYSPVGSQNITNTKPIISHLINRIQYQKKLFDDT